MLARNTVRIALAATLSLVMSIQTGCVANVRAENPTSVSHELITTTRMRERGEATAALRQHGDDFLVEASWQCHPVDVDLVRETSVFQLEVPVLGTAFLGGGSILFASAGALLLGLPASEDDSVSDVLVQRLSGGAMLAIGVAGIVTVAVFLLRSLGTEEDVREVEMPPRVAGEDGPCASVSPAAQRTVTIVIDDQAPVLVGQTDQQGQLSGQISHFVTATYLLEDHPDTHAFVLLDAQRIGEIDLQQARQAAVH